MKATEIAASKLFEVGRWRVEIFTDDNSGDIASRWPRVELGTIAEEVTTAVDPREYPLEQFLYVGLENVESITGDPIDLAMRQKNEIKSRSRIFSNNFVLYGRLRPYLRKVFLTESPYAEGLCSTEFIVLRPDGSRVLPSVLRAMLASRVIATQLARFQIGAALPRVSASDFFRVQVPLPPLDVQEQMAKKVVELQVERRELKSRLKQMPELLEQAVVEFVLGT